MMTQLAREKILYQYINAVERGDFDTVAHVLHQAEQDPELEQMIMEVNDVLGDEYSATVQEETAQLVRQLLEKHLPSSLPNSDDEIDIPPVTLSDVANRLISDGRVQAGLRKEAQSVNRQLSQSEEPLPAAVSQLTISALLEQLGLSVSVSFRKLFHETAVLLSMRREQDLAQLAATRRQKKPQAVGTKKEKQKSDRAKNG